MSWALWVALVPAAPHLVPAAPHLVPAAPHLVPAAPHQVLAAAAERLQGPGPVLFRHPRLSQDGQMFNILTLRTLGWDPGDDGTRGVLPGDARITRLGRVLRAMCSDEFPRLVNILRGEMSRFAPRPRVAMIQVAGQPLAELLSSYGARPRVKPGMTGWAQVNGLSGTIVKLEMAETVIAHDLAYLSEWSFWLDLGVLARAVKPREGPLRHARA